VIVRQPLARPCYGRFARSITGVSEPAAASRFADFPTRSARWVAFGVSVALIAFGLARRWDDGSRALAVVAATVAALACAGLFHYGPRTVAACAAVATAGVAVLGNGTSSNIVWFVICLISAWCLLLGGRLLGFAYWAAAMVLFVAEWIFAESDPGWGAWLGGTTLAAGGAFLVQHEVALVAQLREAQAGLAARAMAEERNRISRELHDVIAHTLTVSLMHVTSARLAVEHDPADAARSLAEAERLGRESLAEVRSAVGLLRESGGDGTAPLPGAERLPSLVEQSRSAGADVELLVSGDLSVLPPTMGLALYRILQESLTNAMKHAAGSPITVGLRIGADSCRLDVDSAGAPGRGNGIGLLSMRERAESLGGSLSAGPGGRGWLVHATLPLAAGLSRAAAP
jgi:signal transduction histidine kinase